jgi:hypothetical protein
MRFWGVRGDFVTARCILTSCYATSRLSSLDYHGTSILFMFFFFFLKKKKKPTHSMYYLILKI